MRITIIGGGKLGTSIARGLRAENHEITVIDKDEAVISNLSNTLDVIGYVGNGASYAVLESAGVSDCDLLIATAETDEVNMLTCFFAHKLGAKHTIARVRDPEFVEELYHFQEDLGLSMAVNPELLAAEEIARVLRLPSATHVELFAGGQVELVSCRLPEDSEFSDVLLSDLSETYGIHALICAVCRGEDTVIPRGDFRLSGGDLLYLTGSPRVIENTLRKLHLITHPVENVMITGGGHVSYYLAEALSKKKIKVKILERLESRAEELAGLLPEATILCGHASDQELLAEEGIDKTDALVALTGLDEGNILSALYAKRKRVPKVIVKVNDRSMVRLIPDGSLETVISPKEVATNHILRYVRAITSRAPEGNVLSLYKLAEGNVEVAEFRAAENSGVVNTPLSELALKKDILVACLVRKGKILFPRGTDSILPEDSVLVVSRNRILYELSDILEVNK